MNLKQNSLVGTIPSELALLSNIQLLSLNENEFVGTITGDVLGFLPILNILCLINNQLTGTVPELLLGDNGVLSELLLAPAYCTV
jgi:hypothetical protein